MREKAIKVALSSLSQPLVSIPPYRGNLLEYIQERLETKEAAYDSNLLKSGYKGKFIINDHKAQSHHWDLRLEFPVESTQKSLKEYYRINKIENKTLDQPGIVLRSWAIPKHTLPKGDDKMLAIETQDHPMSLYNSKGGIIPEGNYGAGEVSVWDKGTFELIDVEYDKIYELKFNGDKIKGSYSLVKFRGDNQFLFFKSKGEKASAFKVALLYLKK